MKHVITAVLMSAAMTTGALAAEHTWVGTVSDARCGASHKSMGNGKMTDQECAQTCATSGAPYALVVDGKVYQLVNHDADLRKHAGHVVELTGELKGTVIRVSRLAATKP
jgi:hypothetical protein